MMKPPLCLFAENPRLAYVLPGDQGEVWRADIVAVRAEIGQLRFSQALFLELKGSAGRTASIYGIDKESGRPDSAGFLSQADVDSQSNFIKMLREESASEVAQMGKLAAICLGIEYTAEAQATAAYIVKRNQPMKIVVGYRNALLDYETVELDGDEAGFLHDARLMSLIPSTHDAMSAACI